MAYGVYIRGMNLAAFVRDVDDAGFLLRRCVHSPWEIAGCPGQQKLFRFQPPKVNPILKNLQDTGVLVQMCRLSFDGRKNRSTGKLLDLRTLASCRPRICLLISEQLHRKATTTYIMLALPPRLSD